jgi:NTE family protein
MDPGTRTLKNDIGYVVCSDAGAPLRRTEMSLFSAFRALRLLDVVMDQARALRVRPLVSFLIRNPQKGAYAQIGADPVQRIHQFASQNSMAADELLKRKWLSSEECAEAAGHSTTLWPITAAQFARLERHGYESLRWNEELFGCSSYATH